MDVSESTSTQKEKEKINSKIEQKNFPKIFEPLRFSKIVTQITKLLDYIVWVCYHTFTFIQMIEITLLASLLTEHNASHWEMSCSDWNKNRIEILSDKNLNSDAHEYLIDYLRT